MKKRNRLFSIFGLSLLAALLLAGCSNLSDPPKKAVIKFDEAKIHCSLASSGGRAEVKSGTPIAENTTLFFTATPSHGKMVSAWKVNGQQKATTQAFLYYANPKELNIKEGQTITITFEEADAQPVTLKLKENVYAYKGIKPEYPGYSSWGRGSSIDNGAEVKAGDHVFFKAKTADNMTVDKWFVNGTAKSSDQEFEYVVEPEQAKDEGGKKVVEISFTLKASMVTVNFDKKSIKAQYDPYENSSWQEFAAGSELKVGTKLKFTALLDDGKTVAAWKLNDVEQKNVETQPKALDSWKYTIDASDVKTKDGKNTIMVSFTDRNKNKIKIEFDKNISCYSAAGAVASGTEVEDGTELTFNADLEDGQRIKKWYKDSTALNGNRYRVSIDDNEALDGKVLISYELYDTVKVAVDATVLNNKPADKVWKVGDGVILVAKVPYGKILEGWYKNGKKLLEHRDYTEEDDDPPTIRYTITDDDARTGTITFSTKVYAEVTLTFDATIEGVYKDQAKTNKITSGTKLKEGTSVYIEPKTPTNQQVKGWKLNGHIPENGLIHYAGSNLYMLTIQNMYASNGTISLSCEFKAVEAAKKIKVQYDKDKIKCENSSSTAVAPDTELAVTGGNNQTESLTFTVIGTDAGKHAVWYVNGVRRGESTTWNTPLELSWVDGGTTPANITYVVKN